MAGHMRPETPDQAREAVRWAAAGQVPLEVVAGGSKRQLGRPVEADHRLDLSALAGITDYAPEELVLTAGPATPLSEITEALAGHGQQLAFEPPDLGPLFGAAPDTGTLGGAIACNLGGPRRFSAGAARDHFLGFAAISGRGEFFRSGGRVVKNVTGYDMSKLMAGSYGTLAVLTEVTVRVVPAPGHTATLLVAGLDAEAAVALLGAAVGGPHGVTGAAHLTAEVAANSSLAGAGAGVTALRLEGSRRAVADRAQALGNEVLAGRGPVSTLEGEASAVLWREIRDAAVFPGDGPLWRLSVPPAAAPAIVNAVGGSGQWFLDWAGGRVWLASGDGEADGGAARIRAALAGPGGHATLIRGPEPLRASVAVFEPEPAPLAALTARVKDSFDPHRVLNRGRMAAGL